MEKTEFQSPLCHKADYITLGQVVSFSVTSFTFAQLLGGKEKKRNGVPPEHGIYNAYTENEQALEWCPDADWRAIQFLHVGLICFSILSQLSDRQTYFALALTLEHFSRAAP